VFANPREEGKNEEFSRKSATENPSEI